MQTWNAERYAREARFVSDLGSGVLELLDAKPGERILDLGCGDGALTERIVATGASVLGVDASAEFVEAARARGLDVLSGDAQALAFAAEFDAVFSNAALHWMPDAEAVVRGVRRALKPGGRFVAEFGGRGNAAAIVTAMAAALASSGVTLAKLPWYFPSTETYAALLERCGFTVETIESFARPTPLPAGMIAWLEVFANSFFAGAEGVDRNVVFAEAERYLRPSLQAEDGSWIADYVRLRFRATVA